MMIRIIELLRGEIICEIRACLLGADDRASNYRFDNIQGAPHGFELVTHNCTCYFKIKQFEYTFGFQAGIGTILDGMNKDSPPILENCLTPDFFQNLIGAEIKDILFSTQSTRDGNEFFSKIEFVTDKEKIVFVAGEYLHDRREVVLGSDEATLIIG